MATKECNHGQNRFIGKMKFLIFLFFLDTGYADFVFKIFEFENKYLRIEQDI